MAKEIHAVTGAFGYSGKYIAQELVKRGHAVITLTNSPGSSNPFGDAIEVFPYDFDNPDKLAKSLQGVGVLYNTYWVRFNSRAFTLADAMANTERLFDAARRAGVRRIVHISIANPSEDSPLEYYRRKAQIEKMLIEAGLSYAIVRPAILFGGQGVLINNIAWMLRRLPVFGVFGDGSYKLRPIYVDDLAKLCVQQGELRQNCIIDAIGPETFTFKELIAAVAKAIGVKRLIVPAPVLAGRIITRLIGLCVGDIMITADEMKALMSNLLAVDSAPTGSTKLTDWMRQHKDSLGKTYTSELSRRRDRNKTYR